jgi:hypothetical protein
MRIVEKSEIVQSQTMTVGDLLTFLKERDVPLDAKIMVQRVEDKYYNGFDISGMDSPEGILPEGTMSEPWGVYLKKGYAYYEAQEINEKMTEEIKKREEGLEPEYPGIVDPTELIQDLNDTSLQEQYHPAWSPVFYDDETDLLFLDLHY